MKKFFSSILFVLFVAFTYAQEIRQDDNGVFYGPDNQLYTGIHKEYHENGTLKMEMTIADGVIDGDVHLYFDNGKAHELRAYKKGEMHGRWLTWNKQGQKIAEAGYEQGQKHGKWYIWNEEGVLLYDMSYTHGERSGTWKMYNEKGELVMEQDF